MNEVETKKLMGIIEAAYPRFYAFEDDDQRSAAAALWHKMLGKVPYAKAEQTVMCYIATHSNPPTIADILKPCLTDGNPEIAWAQLKQAAHEAEKYAQWRKYPMILGYDEKGAPLKSNGVQELHDLFQGLPPAAQEFAGSPDRLVDMGRYGLDEYQHSVFLRTAAALADEQPRLDRAALGTSDAARLRAERGVDAHEITRKLPSEVRT